jgi:hypothetical protein
MLTNWRVWILTSVAALGGAYIIGVSEPVRADSDVTYTLENVEIQGGYDLTGTIVYDTTDGDISSANVELTSGGGDLESFSLLYEFTADDYRGITIKSGQNYGDIEFAKPLTGLVNDTVDIDTAANASYVPYQNGNLNVLEGDVTDAPPETISTPEPTSSIATVIAVTFGLVVSGKRRKLSAREKKRTGYER